MRLPALIAAVSLAGCATQPLPEVSGWSPGYSESIDPAEFQRLLRISDFGRL